MKIFNIQIVLFLLYTGFSGAIFAQSNTAPQPTLGSPYNTIYVHLYYLQPDSYQPEIAAQTIAPGYTVEESIELAVKLKQILDGKGLFVRLNQLPKAPDYTDTLTQKNYYTPFPGHLPEVYLERIDNKWYYSEQTAEAIPTLHNSVFPFGVKFFHKILPMKVKGEFLGLKLWQWLGILVILAICAIAHLILSRVLRPMLNLIAHRKLKFSEQDRQTIMKLARYLSLVLITYLAIRLTPMLLLPIRISEFTNKSLHILQGCFFILFGFFIVDVVTTRAKRLTERTESKMDDQLMPIVNGILKITVAVIGIIYILGLLDFNVAALIAGISIGGIAIALAAQDTVKNFIGSTMIFLDRPFQIGDYVVGDGFEGTIDEVGFRTTRIRAIDTSLISVPNGVLANMTIKNLGVRYFRMLQLTLGVVYSTPATKIEEFTSRLKQMVIDNQNIANEPYYIHFNAMADSSLNIMFRCYLKTHDYAEELAVREEVLLDIVRMAEEISVSFAFPSRSIYMENMQPDESGDKE